MWPFSVLWLLLLLVARPSLAGVIMARPNTADSNDWLSMKTTASHVSLVDGNGTLENIGGRYVTTITLNDRNFRVALDTGSSDLWVVTAPDFQIIDTGLPVGIEYVDGVINGTVGFARMQLGSFSVSSQAFINASIVDFENIVELGLDGLMGLGFNGSKSSDISRVLAAHNRSGSQPFLYNIGEIPEQDHFFAISLSRTDDPQSADASFTIDELDYRYARVDDAPKVPLFPGTNARWSIVVDAITVDGVDIPLVSTVPNTPQGSLVALMDTGTPTATLPPDILYAVYSQIPGASVSVEGDSMWFAIPCNTTSIVTVFIGGLPYPIHPLDLSEIETGEDEDGSTVAACISTIEPLASGSEFDALFGTVVLRNMYSVFNFGHLGAQSGTTTASIQLLSQTDPATAAANVQNVRLAQLADYPPESHSTLLDFIPISPNSPSRPVTTDTSNSDSDDSAPSDVDSGDILAGGAVTAADTFSENGASMRKYALVIIGLLTGNMVVVLVLAACGYTLYTKRSGKGSLSRRTPTYMPVEAREESIGRRSNRFDDDRQDSD